MAQFFTTFLQGIESGAIYASLALAIVIVYRTSGLLNFAQGEMATLSIFLTWQFGEWGLPIGLAIGCGLVVSFVIGVVIERLLIRPVGGSESNALAVVIVTIGLFLALNGVNAYLWGRNGKILPNPFPTKIWHVGDVAISATTIGVLGVLLVEVVLLALLFQKTKVGLGMRAVVSSKESSRLVGVRVGRMLSAGWGLAAVIGAVAGIMTVAATPSLTFDPNAMVGALVFGFAAATLGGFDSPVGAVVAGLIVGLVEKFSAVYVHWIGQDLSVVAAFVVILVVLTVRPQGLFGRVAVVRV